MYILCKVTVCTQISLLRCLIFLLFIFQLQMLYNVECEVKIVIDDEQFGRRRLWPTLRY
jgi:hypothetical protein